MAMDTGGRFQSLYRDLAVLLLRFEMTHHLMTLWTERYATLNCCNVQIVIVICNLLLKVCLWQVRCDNLSRAAAHFQETEGQSINQSISDFFKVA